MAVYVIVNRKGFYWQTSRGFSQKVDGVWKDHTTIADATKYGSWDEANMVRGFCVREPAEVQAESEYSREPRTHRTVA